MTAEGFIARTSDARGNPRIVTSVHPTREDAARAALAADPKAKRVTTCIARHGRETHLGIEQHTRWSLTPQPTTTEA